MADNNYAGVDLAYLSEIAGGSAEFMIEMIDIFIEQTPIYMEELESALAASNWKTVGDVAHKIKPTLAFMGFEEARDQMASIEKKARTLDAVEEIPGMYSALKEQCVGLFSGLEKAKEELKAQL